MTGEGCSSAARARRCSCPTSDEMTGVAPVSERRCNSAAHNGICALPSAPRASPHALKGPCRLPPLSLSHQPPPPPWTLLSLCLSCTPTRSSVAGPNRRCLHPLTLSAGPPTIPLPHLRKNVRSVANIADNCRGSRQGVSQLALASGPRVPRHWQTHFDHRYCCFLPLPRLDCKFSAARLLIS